MGILRRIRRAKPREAILIGRAMAAVLLVRWYLLRRQHPALRAVIERHPAIHGTDVPHSDMTEVAWSIRAAARLVPGATCLTQASAGQLLLARRGYASIVRVSVPAEGGAETIAPHAWLMAGTTILLGGTSAEYDRHRPLHDFVLPDIREKA
ncbi:lasso peptide biosynthesis B2 protein [Paracoccus sp. (in: a-proteobacteria)]|uniref:lasso peptide biosynthesis B2 protein n=1 Tax=Paracoccus sp. TaxID=267 RepID=UPI00396CEE9B